MASSSRFFVDSIDVEDLGIHLTTPLASTSNAFAQSTGSALPCTLFLFNDCLIIAKRESSIVNGKKLAGLDDIEALIKQMRPSQATAAGGGSPVKVSRQLAFRGRVELLELSAMDLGQDGKCLY